MLPGITGLWQISGRSNLTFDDLVRLDFYYIENWSIWLDISILVKTPGGRHLRPRRLLRGRSPRPRPRAAVRLGVALRRLEHERGAWRGEHVQSALRSYT